MTLYEPREIHADVTSPGNSLLVMSEIYYEPGWNLWLDGRPAEVLRADYLLRAVRVPPGKHELKMRFDPPAFRAGVTLSLVAYGLILLGLAGALLVGRRKKRTTPPEASAAATPPGPPSAAPSSEPPSAGA